MIAKDFIFTKDLCTYTIIILLQEKSLRENITARFLPKFVWVVLIVCMGRKTAVVLYVLAMVAVVVGVDVLFLSGRLWLRLAANIGIVLVFGAVYIRFLQRP
jgi:hypothetical protein